MPRKVVSVIADDLDGKDLPEDTKPVTLSLGRTTYNLYLSEANHGKLLEAVNPFIENAETVSSTPARSSSSSSSSADKEKMKKVREWAQASKFKFTDAAGNEKTLGDRGRIPAEVVDAYDKAQ